MWRYLLVSSLFFGCTGNQVYQSRVYQRDYPSPSRYWTEIRLYQNGFYEQYTYSDFKSNCGTFGNIGYVHYGFYEEAGDTLYLKEDTRRYYPIEEGEFREVFLADTVLIYVQKWGRLYDITPLAPYQRKMDSLFPTVLSDANTERLKWRYAHRRGKNRKFRSLEKKDQIQWIYDADFPVIADSASNFYYPGIAEIHTSRDSTAGIQR